MADWRILVRDSSLAWVGELDDFTKADLVLRHRAPGTFTLERDFEAPLTADLLADQAGLIFMRDGRTLASGQITGRERSRDGRTNRIEVSGVDDIGQLARRIIVPTGTPVVAGDGSFTYPDEYDDGFGFASDVIADLVDRHAGANAGVRQIPGLVANTLEGFGPVLIWRHRFTNLLEAIQEHALVGGIGFTCRQVDDHTILFDPYQPADRTDTVVLSDQLGTLGDFSYELAAPEANHVIVGGQGEGLNRVFVDDTDTASVARWGRIESFRDRRDAPSTGELETGATADLAELAEQASIKVTPLTLDRLTFGVDYGLGDRITTVVDGTPIVDNITEVKITLDSNRAEQITPTIAGTNRKGVLRTFDELRAARRRISHLERR